MPCLEDLRLMAYLHGGFPLVDEPYAAVAQALGTTEQDVLQRLQRLLDDGYQRMEIGRASCRERV